MPIEECRASEHVAFVLTKHGSHCGHMKGLWPWKQSWLDALVMQFFATILADGRPGAGQMLSADSMLPGSELATGHSDDTEGELSLRYLHLGQLASSVALPASLQCQHAEVSTGLSQGWQPGLSWPGLPASRGAQQHQS